MISAIGVDAVATSISAREFIALAWLPLLLEASEPGQQPLVGPG